MIQITILGVCIHCKAVFCSRVKSAGFECHVCEDQENCNG